MGEERRVGGERTTGTVPTGRRRRGLRFGAWALGVGGLLAVGLASVGVALLFLALRGPAPDKPTSEGEVTIGPATPVGAQATRGPTALVPTAGSGVGGVTTPAAQAPTPSTETGAAGLVEDPRVDQALGALSTDEARVGQLLLLGWAGNTAEQARQTLLELRPGGIIFIDNTRVAAEATAINAALPGMAREYGVTPPLIAMDHEGGSVQRLRDVPNLGTNEDFAGGRPSDRAACERGLAHARTLRELGFTMNLAPVLDVNNNPNNPVIGDRSYGADPEVVARLGSAYVRGLQGGGIVAVGKHFPGHGNTDVDSHLQLPILPLTEAQLAQVELIPFRRAIAPPTGIAGIMSAHIVFPAVDPSRMPATLSRAIMTGLLRDTLGFGGLAVSDDVAAMKAITDNFGPGEAAVQAVRAGIDLVIIGGDLARQRESRDALLGALASGELSRDRLDEAVRRVLGTKARFGLLGGAMPPVVGCS